MFIRDDALLKLCFFSELIHVSVQDTPDVPYVGDPHEGSAAPFEEAPRSVPQGVLASRPQGFDGLPDHQSSGEHPAKASLAPALYSLSAGKGPVQKWVRYTSVAGCS